MRLKETGLGA